MSVKRIAVDYAYGISDALIPLAPLPIVAKRDPQTNDFAQLGTTWVNEVDSSVWVLASVTNNSANWTTSPASGIGAFTSLAVNPGNVNLVAGNLTLGAGNISLTAGNLNVGGSLTVGGAIAFSGSIDFTSASDIVVTSTFNGAPSIDLEANGGTNEQILIHSNQGTAANAILLAADAGGITLTAAGAIAQSAGSTFALNAVGALSVNSSAGAINIGNNAVAQAINIGTGAAARTITIGNTTGASEVIIRAGTNGILIGDSAVTTPIDVGNFAPTASRTITVGGGTVVTAAVTDLVAIAPGGATTNANSIKRTDINSGNVTTGQSVVNINSGTAASGTSTVNISTGTGGGTKAVNIGNADGLTNVTVNAKALSLGATTASNFTVTGAGQDLTLASSGGSVSVLATENTASAVLITTNGGTSETLVLNAVQGTAANSINLVSNAGGITLTSNLATANGITLNAVGGGINVNGATASHFSTAAGDLTLSAATNSVVISGAEAVIDAVQLTASNGAVQVTGGALAATTGLRMVQGAASALIQVGTGAPAHNAPKGSLYLRTDGSTTNDRAYIATDAVGTWTAITTVA